MHFKKSYAGSCAAVATLFLLAIPAIGGVTLEHTLDDPVSQPGATFGGVAGVGDVNGDSVPDVAVAAPSQNVGGNGGQGQVFVFSGADGTLLYTLDDPSPQANARFGWEYGVISIGDLNGDSVPEIGAGALWQTVAGSWRQGQFFVFSGADGALLYTLSHPNPQTDAHFGASSAAMGDVNSDGAADMAVSAHTQTVGGTTRQGQVYVFSGIDGSLLYTVDHPSPQAHSAFGKTLGAVGDVDADSISDLVVGADLQTVGGNWRQGQAYVFSGADGSFLYTLDDPIPQSNGRFGWVPSGVGDVDGDGVPDIAVGAILKDVGGTADQGQVFVFSGADGSLLHTLTDPSPNGSGHFGFSIAELGLLDGDAIPDVAVGIQVKNVGGNSAQGQVSIFSGADGSLLLTLDHPNPMGHASFGSSIAKLGVVNGTTLFAVGAPIQDIGGNADQGQAYVFSISLDSDSDGISDVDDNCPTVYNAGQDDADSDGEGDVCDDCTDTDSDGFGNPGFPDNTCAPDNCPNDANDGQEDSDSDVIGDVCDACPNDPDNDLDGDGVCGDMDDCPGTVNPSQSDVDSDGAGDLCDVCPADRADECDPSGSTAEEITADEGGTVETPDGELTIDIDSDDLAEDSTISVTQTTPQDPEVDLMVGPISGLGQAVSVYDLEPDGQVFDAPVTLTIITDVSDLNPVFFDKLSLYLWTDTDGDGMEDRFVEIDGAMCSVVNVPVGCDPKHDPPTVCVSTATCTAEVDHFSVYALVAPLDSDDDGIPDLFGGVEDICPDDPNVIEGFLPPMTNLVPEGEVTILPDKAFKSNRTLPMKFDYYCGTVLVTDQDAVTPPELLGVYRVGDAEPLPIVDPDSGESNDSGVWFRYSDEHWIYNFSTSGLPGGTYEVHVRMSDGRIFKGGFVLR